MKKKKQDTDCLHFSRLKQVPFSKWSGRSFYKPIWFNIGYTSKNGSVFRTQQSATRIYRKAIQIWNKNKLLFSRIALNIFIACKLLAIPPYPC